MGERVTVDLGINTLRNPIPGPGEHPYKGAAISEVLLGTEATCAARISAITGVGCCTFESTVPIPLSAEFIPNLDT
jgi:hypothetical protein